MILYENMKPIEHFLLHMICARHQLMCACKLRNVKLSLFIEHIEVADEFITYTMFGLTYCTAASLFRYELHKERAAHLYDK